MISSTQIFNGEYTDMAFEIKDNHIFIGDTSFSKDGYNQMEVYNIDLKLKYREQKTSKIIVSLNYNDINLDDYKDTIVYLKIEDNSGNIIREKSKLELINDKIIILDENINYSEKYYQYNINFEFYNKYDERDIKNSYELASRISADLI